MEPVIRLLADLVAIPSMNPMGRARSGKEYVEQSLAEFVAAFLKKHSIDAQQQQVAPGRPNVVGYVDAKACRTLLLEAHLDTVHAEGMAIDPFNPLIRDEKLYGRGSCDTKGSIAAFLQAVINALQEREKLKYNVLLLFVSDEEYRFTGAQHAARNGLKADFGIASEPTQLRIVRAHKGVTRWKIVTKGLAAHSAFPDRGKNAIYTMSEVIKRLEGYAAQLQRKKADPLLGTPTLSVGVIEGGQAVNVVPDRCWIEIDRRTLPGENLEAVLDPVRALLQDLPDWEFEPPYLSVAGMEVGENAPIVQILAGSIKDVLGSVMIETAHYATDAGFYNNVGIPTVVFGPGDIAQAHTDSEFVELQQVHRAVNIIQRLLTT
ncbi:MAG: M20 family metallopeptidase [Bacteroidota bacterium]